MVGMFLPMQLREPMEKGCSAVLSSSAKHASASLSQRSGRYASGSCQERGLR